MPATTRTLYRRALRRARTAEALAALRTKAARVTVRRMRAAKDGRTVALHTEALARAAGMRSRAVRDPSPHVAPKPCIPVTVTRSSRQRAKDARAVRAFLASRVERRDDGRAELRAARRARALAVQREQRAAQALAERIATVTRAALANASRAATVANRERAQRELTRLALNGL